MEFDVLMDGGVGGLWWAGGLWMTLHGRVDEWMDGWR